MAAPLPPAGLNPSLGQTIPVSETNSFTWQTDPAQTGYYIEWRLDLDGAEINTTDWQNSSIASHNFAGHVFVSTKAYMWRIKIRNYIGQESVFSDWAVFMVGSSAGVAITFPANDLDVLSAVPVYRHEYSNPDGFLQVAYQYRLFTGTTWNDFDDLTAAEQESMTWDELEAHTTGIELWDSGRVESTATSVPQPSDKLLILQYWYKVQVTIWDNAGNEITSDIRTYGLLAKSVPQIPTINVTADGVNGRNVAIINNPLPAVGQISAHHNKLYRRKPGSSWELILDNVIGGIGYDTTCRSGVEEEYAASAVSIDGIESSKSKSSYATCQLTSYWFTNLTTKETVKLRLEARWGQMQSERGREEYSGADSIYPRIGYDSRRFYRGSFQGAVERPSGSTSWTDYIASLATVLDAGDTVLYRSLFGDVLKVDIYDFEFQSSSRFDQYRAIKFNIVETEEAGFPTSYDYDYPHHRLEGYWVIDPDTGLGMRVHIGADWGGMKSEQDRFEGVGLSETMPKINRDNKKAYRGGFSGYLRATETESCGEIVNRFRELIDGLHKKPLLFKSISGDVFLVDIYGFSFELYDRFDNARRVSFEMVEVGTSDILLPQEAEHWFLDATFPALFGKESES